MEHAEPGSTHQRRVAPIRRGGFAAGPIAGRRRLHPYDPGEQATAIDSKLQVRNLPTDMTDYELSELFARCGQVLNARIVRDGSSGMSKGYGFVTMSALSEADTAVSRLDGHALRGRTLDVRLARPRIVRGNEAMPQTTPRKGREQ